MASWLVIFFTKFYLSIINIHHYTLIKKYNLSLEVHCEMAYCTYKKMLKVCSSAHFKVFKNKNKKDCINISDIVNAY